MDLSHDAAPAREARAPDPRTRRSLRSCASQRPAPSPSGGAQPLTERIETLLAAMLAGIHARASHLFAALMLVQCVMAAVLLGVRLWAGTSTLPLVVTQLLAAGALSAAIASRAIAAPAAPSTRLAIGAIQALWSAYLIFLTDGRIETHFHNFVSLGLLAFYLDWRVLLTYSVAMFADHLVRGVLWPASLFGVNEAGWRIVEHIGWALAQDAVLVLGVLWTVRWLRELAAQEAWLEGTELMMSERVEAQTEELRASVARFRQLVESTRAAPWEIEPATMHFTYISPQATRFFGIDFDAEPTGARAQGSTATREAYEKLVRDMQSMSLLAFVHPDDRQRVETEFRKAIQSSTVKDFELEFQVRSLDARDFLVRTLASVDRHPAGDARVVRGMTLDVTQQRKVELELRHAQKLESVGRLAAGVAHEINTPVHFVGDSVHFVQGSVAAFTQVFGAYREALAHARRGEAVPPALLARVEEVEVESDVEYSLARAPGALARATEGLERVAKIVRSLKAFSHPDSTEMAAADLNEAVRSTLVIAANEYKYVADLVTNFGELPPVPCFVGEVNQVVLNLVVNAAHAIEQAAAGSGARGIIHVTTRTDGRRAIIEVADTGTGIPPEARQKIFDPFFTTKPVGKGTGQGLAISRTIIVDKHHGNLDFESTVGQGTTFRIALPLSTGANEAPTPAAA